jgi:hypothetical protein
MKLDLILWQALGQRISTAAAPAWGKNQFQTNPNLELGFTRTVELGGLGRGLTFGHRESSYFSLTSVVNETPNTDHGKRMGL